eukprot:TRINITY_DN82283_c0_g1_i1.p1 TRINITY_DN82283_c0_g1~~TRINITY_DN82283_c0_g1_i1.p1  ORF type:complete len:160 (+),score=18.98 TRINITY_DN82283_c0_g1_i1:23-502(+)
MVSQPPHRAVFRPTGSRLATDALNGVSSSAARAAVAYRLDEPLERGRSQSSPLVASRCASASLFAGVCALLARNRNICYRNSHARRLRLQAQQRDESGGTPWLEIASAVAFALLDIFKAPPEEATGADAPGLKEMTVAPKASLEKCEITNVRSDKQSIA